MNSVYAHTHPDFPSDSSRWQPLETHLRNVAERAKKFVVAFYSTEWQYN